MALKLNQLLVTFYRKFGIAVLILLLSSQSGFSQRGQFGIAFSAGLPQSEFHETLNDNGFGVDGNLAFRLGESPFSLGAEFGYLIYGSESRNVPFSQTIPDVYVDVETSNNILQSFVFLRAQNDKGAIRPYLDGLLGFNYLFTRTSIQDDSFFQEEEIAGSTNYDDFAFSYGGGGGVMIRLHDPDPDAEPIDKRATILLDLRLRYLYGGEAEYLRQGGIERINGEVLLNPVRSRTDMLTFNIGLAFVF